MATTVIATHKVENFAKWKQGFDTGKSMRDELGIHIKGVYQSSEDENDVTIISEFPNAETAKALMSNKELTEAMKNGGVISEVEVKMLEEVI